MEKTRCAWVTSSPLYQDYHDHEWGVPEHDDRMLFEMLNLEGAQAGLSWITILNKRENYRRVFDAFDPEKIVRYSDKRLAKILQDPGIVRNRLKVHAVVTNAKAYLVLRDQDLTLNEYLWQFVDGKPIVNQWTSIKQVPAKTDLSDQISKDLKKRGFKFIGSTICYAFMQAVGIVNDHTTDCFRWKECQ